MVSLLLALIYLSFISLGLPDAMLGSAWPKMYVEFQVPLSYAGIISSIIAIGTVISSLESDRLTLRLGPGKVTAISVAMTALGLFGFSISHSFIFLCLWAVPYGLGAGSVDAALNNYVALHYESRHMSWLHCMWGIGAALGPSIMGAVLTGGGDWNSGYRIVSILQVVLSAILFISLPIWKNRKTVVETKDAKDGDARAGDSREPLTEEPRKPLSLKAVLQIPGAWELLICFLCYSGVEQTTGLWAASYLTVFRQVDATTAATYGALFYIGITVGRAISGFLTLKFSDLKMIRLGSAILLLGILLILLPLPTEAALAGIVIIGLGCAPIYPCIIHSTPAHFGADRSQAVIGVQMAFAYIGTVALPPLFGFLANNISMTLWPWYLLFFLILMTVLHERMNKITMSSKA